MLKLLNDQDRHLTDIQWEMDARLLQNVFKNATFITHPFGCGKITELACDDQFQPFIYIGSSSTGKIDNSNFLLHSDALTFISCSNPNYKGLAFHMLISVLDKYVWIYLIVSILSISLFSATVLIYGQKLVCNNLIKNLHVKTSLPNKLADYLKKLLLPYQALYLITKY